MTHDFFLLPSVLQVGGALNAENPVRRSFDEFRVFCCCGMCTCVCCRHVPVRLPRHAHFSAARSSCRVGDVFVVGRVVGMWCIHFGAVSKAVSF